MQCVGPEKGQPNSSNFPSPRRSYVWSIEQHEDAHRSKICTPILFANVNELNSFSFPALVVVAYSLQHRKRQKSHLLRNLMTLFSIIVSDMYSLRVSIAVLRMR